MSEDLGKLQNSVGGIVWVCSLVTIDPTCSAPYQEVLRNVPVICQQRTTENDKPPILAVATMTGKQYWEPSIMKYCIHTWPARNYNLCMSAIPGTSCINSPHNIIVSKRKNQQLFSEN